LERNKKLKKCESVEFSDWRLWTPFLLSMTSGAYLTFKFPENLSVIIFS
jgi:hypothetical protein